MVRSLLACGTMRSSLVLSLLCCSVAAAMRAGVLQLAPNAAAAPSQLRSALVRCPAPIAKVIEVSSTEEFDEALKSAGDSLVVIDYSTSWCGPCKIIAPKFEEFSENYKNVAFLKVGLLASVVKSCRMLHPDILIAICGANQSSLRCVMPSISIPRTHTGHGGQQP
eukprot:1752944-Pleurochrysis_carterae.AAC.5